MRPQECLFFLRKKEMQPILVPLKSTFLFTSMNTKTPENMQNIILLQDVFDLTSLK